MKLTQQSAAARPTQIAPRQADVVVQRTDWTMEAPLVDLIRGLDRSLPIFTTRVPGRLDVMGGSAAQSGAMAWSALIDGHAYCVAQKRTDGRVLITSSDISGGNGIAPIAINAAGLPNMCANGRDALNDIDLASGSGGELARHVLGTMLALVQTGFVTGFEDGVSIIVASTNSSLGDLGSEAALGSAIALATTSAFGISLEINDISRVLDSAGKNWLAYPIAHCDLSVQLHAKPELIVQTDGVPRSCTNSLRLPAGAVLVGVSCGTELADARERFDGMRTAAQMGRAIIERVIKHEGIVDLRWEIGRAHV